MSFYFAPAARAEHLEHITYYEAQQQGLGARYAAAFDTAMVRVCEAPSRYRIDYAPGIRRFLMSGFPFHILYRQLGADIEVLAVAHYKRRPGYWQDRS